MQYYETLKQLREDHDKKQDDIAKVIGTSRSYYGSYERGLHPLPVEHLKKLCEYYNVSSDFVLGLPKGMPYPNTKIIIK